MSKQITSTAAAAELAKINASTKARRVALTLIHIAATSKPATKVAAKAALKAAGLRQTLSDTLLAEVARLDAARKTAKIDRIDRRLGYCPVAAVSRSTSTRWGSDWLKGTRSGPGISIRTPESGAHGRAPVRLPGGTPQSRLDVARKATLASQLRASVRIGVNDQVSIGLTTDPAKIGLTQSECTDWDKYKGPYKGWACNYKSWTLTAPSDWRVRVAARNLAMVDGMMTLDASPIETTGCELYAATWLIQGRGTSCTMVRGYIARSGTTTYHGKTADQALSGIARKVRELEFSARLDAADLSDLVARCAWVRVSVGDAKAMGACEYGIRSWCANVGLDYESGSATLGEVYAAYQREPRTEARATILRVLRQHRAAIVAI